MHQKVSVLIILIYVPKRQFGKKSSLTILLFALVFIFSSQTFFYRKFIRTRFLCHGPLLFSTIASLLPPSLQKKTHLTMSVGNVGLEYVFWGPWTLWSHWHFFLDVHQSGPGTSSTSIHICYMALGQLHGPWCKQPLRVSSLLSLVIYKNISYLWLLFKCNLFWAYVWRIWSKRWHNHLLMGLWDVQAKSCISQFHYHFSIDIKVIRKVPQIETKLWVSSFFEKLYIKSSLASRVWESILKVVWNIWDLFISPLELPRDL